MGTDTNTSTNTSKEERFIDLDTFVPDVEPLTLKVNGKTYKVKEPTVEIYLRILRLGDIGEEGFEEAKQHFFSIFKETVPDLPDEVIYEMEGPKVTGYLTFLIRRFLAVANDPNFLKPMLMMRKENSGPTSGM